jgi:hypothetical protein
MWVLGSGGGGGMVFLGCKEKSVLVKTGLSTDERGSRVFKR